MENRVLKGMYLDVLKKKPGSSIFFPSFLFFLSSPELINCAQW